jgi:sirohydrochlorin ferrochelatase
MMKTALLLIDHGSKRKAANYMLFELVKLLRKQRPDLLIYGAHMELAIPTIEEGIQWCVKQGATHIIAHPYMLAPGRHASEDIPNMVKEAMLTYPAISYAITEPLGVDLNLTNLILKRAGV